MACFHKFHNDLQLQYLDYAPETLIVGTFEAGLPGNEIGWFYGRTADDCFWDVLPRLYGSASLTNATAAEWRLFCHDNRIAITGLIGSIDDANIERAKDIHVLQSYSDKAIAYNFEDFTFIDIVVLLQQHPSIKNVYLTRGITEAFWRHLWNPVIGYCGRNGIHERRLMPPLLSEHYQHDTYNSEHPDAQISRLEDYILMRWQEEWHR